MKAVWPFALYRVSGGSMLPTYKPGDLVMGWKWFKLKPNQVVVVMFDRPRIKRVKQVWKDTCWVEGDNPDHSSDSRSLGPVNNSDVVAKVIAKL